MSTSTRLRFRFFDTLSDTSTVIVGVCYDDAELDFAEIVDAARADAYARAESLLGPSAQYVGRD